MLSSRKTYRKDNLRDVEKVFNDGICKIYVANERVLGNSKGKFYFANESVGIGHFYQAYNNNISIDRAIAIPLNDISIDTQDVVLLEGIWYKIARIQYKDDKKPRHWILSLQRSPFNYVEVNNANN